MFKKQSRSPFLAVVVAAVLLSFLVPDPALCASVTLRWDANDPAPEGYLLYKRVQGGTYDYTTPAWRGPETTCTIDAIAEDTTYYFVVRAFNGSNYSDNSNEISYRYNPPAPATYTLSASAGPGGAITPSGSTSVVSGGTVTFLIMAHAGYRIADVRVDGGSVGAVSSFTFNSINADHTISAQFAVNTYSVTASAGSGGAISPSGTISIGYGESRTFTITPDTGYRIADVLVNGKSVGAVSSYTITGTTADQSISAVFAAITYSVTASAGSGGGISPAGTISIGYGESRTFTITPDTGYRIADVLMNGKSVGAVSSYTITGTTVNQSISAVFQADIQPLVADAGPDQNVEEGQKVVLSGLNSRYPDDGTVSMQWRQIQGPTVALNGAQTAETAFTAPDVGVQGVSLIFELTVSRITGESSSDTCIVNVVWVNMPPSADAGEDQVVFEGRQVTLDALNSTDPDDGIVAYRWKQIQGPTVTLSDPDSAKTTFTAPSSSKKGVSLVFELTVTDNGGLQSTDTCLVTVMFGNNPPVADAGADQLVYPEDEVQLNAAGSFDPDDGIASYQWKQTAGPPVVLSDAGSVRTFFTAPSPTEQDIRLTFQLTVTDTGGLQSTDNCQVTVKYIDPKWNDTEPPVTTIVVPDSSFLVYRQNKIALGGTASDNVRVDRVIWQNDRGGSGLAEGTTDWTIPEVRLARGYNRITVTAIDAAGNESSAGILIYTGLFR